MALHNKIKKKTNLDFGGEGGTRKERKRKKEAHRTNQIT